MTTKELDDTIEIVDCMMDINKLFNRAEQVLNQPLDFLNRLDQVYYERVGYAFNIAKANFENFETSLEYIIIDDIKNMKSEIIRFLKYIDYLENGLNNIY